MFGRYERRTWESDPSLHAPPRYRRACSYDAFIPLPIENLEVSVSGAVAATVSEAEAAIRELNTGGHPALAPLARLLLRTESIASSKVEGMHVDARTLARAEVSTDIGQRAAPTALEVLGNIDAMQLAIENASSEELVGVEQIVEIHRALLQQAPNSQFAGKIRTVQNWIGGNDYNPCGADFVPPPPEEVPWLLGDLCRFCNDDRLPPLIQASIAHAQFETIHPFEDGNGRTGRALVQVILRRRGLAPAYVPPISVILAANKERYISGLTAFREGQIEAWLEIFDVSAARAAHLARRYLGEVESLQERWRGMLRESGRIRVDAAAWKLIEVLPAQPIVTLPSAVAKIERTKPAVNQAIEQLSLAGVLIPISEGKRNRAWEADGLLDLLVRLESGEAPEGEPEQVPTSQGVGRRVLQTRSIDPIVPVDAEARIRLPFTDPIYRLSPGAWLVGSSDRAEITLRIAVAIPSVLPLGGPESTQLVTQLRGQRREELLIALLDVSAVTAWLRSLRDVWHWEGHVDWTPAGSGSPEFTELWFSPFGLDNPRPSFAARCGFATGLAEDDDAAIGPAIQSALDVMINLGDLGADRQPIVDPQPADQAPAPAALSLLEISEILAHLLDFTAVTESAAAGLLSAPQSRVARIAEWLSVWGGNADRVIDMRTLRRIPRSTGLSETSGALLLDRDRGWALSVEEIRTFVKDILYEGLERGGYRDLDRVIDDLQPLHEMDGGVTGRTLE